MTRAILLMLFSALLTFGYVKLAKTKRKEYFHLQCPFRWGHAFWIRSPHYVLGTFWSDKPTYTPEGDDLRNRTEVHDALFSRHEIKVKINDRDRDSYWRCCRYDLFENLECSSWYFVKISQELITTGKLDLTIMPETPTEGQAMTLSCNIDAEIEQEKWIIVWLRNDMPMFITDTNSSIFKAENITDMLNQFINERTDSEELRNHLEYLFQNADVSVNAFQHNVTIPVSLSLIGNTSWSCSNSYVSNLSNTVTIQVTPMSTSSKDPERIFTSTESIIPEETVLDLTDDASTSAYIVAGSVCGIVVVLIVIMVTNVHRWRRKKDIIMEDNVLYAKTDGDVSQENSTKILNGYVWNEE